jgi:glycosyltransferase involved in cell wall biosynthesis
VPPGDEHKLAEAMARLLNDADLRAHLAAGAAERVRRFTASAVVERLEAVYARVAPRNHEISPKGRQAGVDGRDADGS